MNYNINESSQVFRDNSRQNNMNSNGWTVIRNIRNEQNTRQTNTQQPNMHQTNTQQPNMHQTNTQQTAIICHHFARNNCRNYSRCRFGLHISEEERNSRKDVSICYKFINSPYNHSIVDCVNTNNGLCEYCAFGECLHKNMCVYRHDANERYKNDLKNKARKEYKENKCEQAEIESTYIIPSKEYKCNSWHKGEQIYIPCSEKSKTSEISGTNKLPLPLPSNTNLESYKMGSKPPPRIRIKNVKKKDVEEKEEYYYDEHGYECIKIVGTSTVINSSEFNVSVNSTVKSDDKRISKKSKKSKEVLSFDDAPDICEVNSLIDTIVENEISNKIFYQPLLSLGINSVLESTPNLDKSLIESANDSPKKILKQTVLQRQIAKIKKNKDAREEKRFNKSIKSKSKSDSDSDSDYNLESDSDSEFDSNQSFF
jgi:hypothetical protein